MYGMMCHSSWVGHSSDIIVFTSLESLAAWPSYLWFVAKHPQTKPMTQQCSYADVYGMPCRKLAKVVDKTAYQL